MSNECYNSNELIELIDHGHDHENLHMHSLICRDTLEFKSYNNVIQKIQKYIIPWLYRPNGLLIRKFEQHYYYNELVLRKPLVMS